MGLYILHDDSFENGVEVTAVIAGEGLVEHLALWSADSIVFSLHKVEVVSLVSFTSTFINSKTATSQLRRHSQAGLP